MPQFFNIQFLKTTIFFCVRLQEFFVFYIRSYFYLKKNRKQELYLNGHLIV